MSAQRTIASAALVIMVGSVASRLLGLVREQVMAWLFGATGATDAFVAASAVPLMVYDLLVGGAISAALVPVLVEAADQKERLSRLLSSLLSLAGLLLLGVAMLLAIFADGVIAVLGFGFSAEQHREAVVMVRVMLAAVVFQGLAGVLMAALYAGNRFVRPAFAPAIFNGGIILMGLLLHQALGVAALVVGVLLGAVGQLLLQLGGLRSLRLRPSLAFASPEVRSVIRLYTPVALGMLVSIAGITLDRFFASQLEAGSMTVMGYATRLIQFPLGLVATATAFAVLPTLSRLASGSEPAQVEDASQRFREALTFGIKIVLLLMVPATLGLILLREPLVRLLFEHRAFSAYDTQRTATVLLYYAPQLPLTAIDQLLVFAYYARRDTVTPVVVGVVAVLLYLVGAVATLESMGVNGLALANTIQNGAHGLILLGLMARGAAGLINRDLTLFMAKTLVAALAMAAVMALVATVWILAEEPGLVGQAMFLLAQALLGVGLYGGAIVLLRVPEAGRLMELARSRARRHSSGTVAGERDER